MVAPIEELVPWTEEMEAERPTVVDPGWMVYSRVMPGRWRTYEEAATFAAAEFDAIAAGWEAGVLAYPHGWHVHEFEDGTFGASLTYWAPPPERVAKKKAAIGIGVVLGVGAAVGITAVVAASAAKGAGKRKRR